MSGGEQQRTAIATALANEPRVLLADEPTGELDSATAREVFAALQTANTELGVTVLVVTHDPAVSAQVRRTIAIRDGRTSTETLRHDVADEHGNATRHAVEYAVLDRAGRVQLPRDMTEALGMRDRVRLQQDPDHIGVWPDQAASRPGGPPACGTAHPATPGRTPHDRRGTRPGGRRAGNGRGPGACRRQGRRAHLRAGAHRRARAARRVVHGPQGPAHRPVWPVRLGQDHAAERHRRPGRADRGHRDRGRPGGHPDDRAAPDGAAQGHDRVHLPVVRADPHAVGGGERRHPTADHRHAVGRPGAAGRDDAGDRRPVRTRRAPPGRAVRRPAAAHRHRPGAGRAHRNC